MPESRSAGRSGIDFAGVISSVGLVALMYGVLEAGGNGWGSSSAIVPVRPRPSGPIDDDLLQRARDQRLGLRHLQLVATRRTCRRWPSAASEEHREHPCERRHPRLLWGFRIVWGIDLLGLAILALSNGNWLALLFLVAAAADFLFGYRIYRIAQSQPPT